ncbi:MAG: poly-beta-1,6-N-acetyl-D-glucosamine N-deacetylase PgaB [Pseudomonadota bacterium]
MTWLARLLLGFLLPVTVIAAPGDFHVLSYHDVRDDVAIVIDDDQTAISTDRLVSHFAWLKEHDYPVVSLQQIIDASHGRASLPPRAVLLTFDDGYASTYHKVFPLLKAFGYSAVVAVVGEWLSVTEGGTVAYGNDDRQPRSRFLSAAHIREMTASGLVEFASHSYRLHRGILGNPQGNLLPAAYRKYSPGTGRESTAAYRERIQSDLARASTLIERLTGEKPRAMVWPYGAYSEELVEHAAAAGMRYNFTLDSRANRLGELTTIHRRLVSSNPGVEGLEELLADFTPTRLRAAQVDLDYVYDENPEQVNANLSRLLDRIKSSGLNTVFLQAFADPDGDGIADALYFPNRYLPVRADLFNRVAWQLRTRAGVQVYAWLPVLGFDLDESHPRVLLDSDPPAQDPNAYPRLSPFSAHVRKSVAGIYEDLARGSAIAGLLFHDDALLSDREDASDAGRAEYRDWGHQGTLSEIRNNAQAFEDWSKRKEASLYAFTDELATTVRRYHPDIKTARNLYARPVIDENAQTWFAQSLRGFLAHYDYTALMAMPYMEQTNDPEGWLRALYEKVSRTPNALEKTVFELQTRDWRSEAWIPDDVLRTQVRQLRRLGVRHFAYYPDDFVSGKPSLDAIRASLAAETYPYQP